MFTGLSLLAWIVGLTILAACVYIACYITPDAVDVRDAQLPPEFAAHDARMNARAARLGMPR